MSRATLPEQKYSAESMQRVAMMRTRVLKAGSEGSLGNHQSADLSTEDTLTRHLSRDAANAPELETSSASPLRFLRMSWSFSKFAFGGGRCRLRHVSPCSSLQDRPTHLSTAVCGNVSWILRATLMLASNINSSTRLFVSRSSFCSTSMGSDDSDVSIWIFTSGDAKLTLLGHEHFLECCALAPHASYRYLASFTTPAGGAGPRRPPPATETAEFMATGSRDKTIRLWDARGTCLATLAGHDSWVRALLFHPGGRYLLSASDDKTLRCWDLAQGGKCVKVLSGVHEAFIASLKWAPGVEKDSAGRDAEADAWKPNSATGESAPGMQIRCVIATGGVDQKVRIFAN